MEIKVVDIWDENYCGNDFVCAGEFIGIMNDGECTYINSCDIVCVELSNATEEQYTDLFDGVAFFR